MLLNLAVLHASSPNECGQRKIKRQSAVHVEVERAENELALALFVQNFGVQDALVQLTMEVAETIIPVIVGSRFLQP